MCPAHPASHQASPPARWLTPSQPSCPSLATSAPASRPTQPLLPAPAAGTPVLPHRHQPAAAAGTAPHPSPLQGAPTCPCPGLWPWTSRPHGPVGSRRRGPSRPPPQPSHLQRQRRHRQGLAQGSREGRQTSQTAAEPVSCGGSPRSTHGDGSRDLQPQWHGPAAAAQAPGHSRGVASCSSHSLSRQNGRVSHDPPLPTRKHQHARVCFTHCNHTRQCTPPHTHAPLNLSIDKKRN